MNINLDSKTKITKDYKKIIKEHEFINLIQEATRTNSYSSTIIDHILINKNKLNQTIKFNTRRFEFCSLDHDMIGTAIPSQTQKIKIKNGWKLNQKINDESWDSIQLALQCANWSMLFSYDNANEKTYFFYCSGSGDFREIRNNEEIPNQNEKYSLTVH